MSRALFHTLLPWCFITSFHEGVVVQKDGILQRTFAYRAPDVDSSDAASVNALCLRVNDFAKRLGESWAFFLEAQRFYTCEYPACEFESSGYDALAPYLVDREREASFRASGRHFESSYYLTFAWRQPAESVKKLTSLFFQGGSTGSAKTIEENVEFFTRETDAVAAVLAGGMLLAPLSNEETAAYLHSAVSLNRHPLRLPENALFLDRLLPDSPLETTLTMKLGDHYIPIVGVCDYPDETYPAILDALNRARFEYRWMTRYICTGKEEGKKDAKKKEKFHIGNQLSLLQLLSREPPKKLDGAAVVKESDAEAAGIEIDTDEAALGYLTTNVMVWDEDYEAAREKAGEVKALINGAGFTCKDETLNALEAWKSMLPGEVFANIRALPVMSYSLSHVVPLSSVWAGVRQNAHAQKVSGEDAPHVVGSTADGTPFFLNLNPGLSDVGHAAVWGPTGAGKSTLLNLLELQFFKYPGAQVIVFDKGRSCRAPCLASGGSFYEPSGESEDGVSFQPLSSLETDRDLLDAQDFIEACITVNGYAVTPPMRSAIKESLEQLSEKPLSARTLTSFIDYANYLDPETKRPVLKEMLGDYLIDGGKYGKIFDTRSQGFSIGARFLAVEMEALMNRGETCVAPALVYLFNLVEKKFDGRLTLLVLDEAWLFLKNETFSEKIAEWLKVLRKKNVFVVFATQDVADVERSPLKTAIMQQCLTKIYLADPSASAPAMFDVYRAFGLTDSEIYCIASAQMKRDYFYTSPLGRRMFTLDLGPLTLALIGSPDHALLDRLQSETGAGAPLCRALLAAKKTAWKQLAGTDAPKDAPKQNRPDAPPRLPAQVKAERPATENAGTPLDILNAVRALPDRKPKDGSGRAASLIAARFNVGEITIYRARRLLKSQNTELIAAVESGDISIKTACKRLAQEGSVA